jgi:hypothetical protein
MTATRTPEAQAVEHLRVNGIGPATIREFLRWLDDVERQVFVDYFWDYPPGERHERDRRIEDLEQQTREDGEEIRRLRGVLKEIAETLPTFGVHAQTLAREALTKQ